MLFVCTGNVCRSPAAERLLAATGSHAVHVSSAGSYAMVGKPISAPMVPLLTSAGADPQSFAARQLTEEVVRGADLVLGLSREHRMAAVEMWPGVVRRAFTLLEFTRLLEVVDPTTIPPGSVAERFRAVIPLAAAERRQVRGDPTIDDIADPYLRSEADYAHAFGEIQEAIQTIVRVVIEPAD